LVHDAPLVLHAAAVVAVTHELPAQQPDAQLVESHTQVPLRHRWPGAQAALPPHRHAPDTHESETPLHTLQAPPPPPHAAGPVPAWQTPLRQHPEGHEVASQTHCPASHR
jgi:hypothetical protein